MKSKLQLTAIYIQDKKKKKKYKTNFDMIGQFLVQFAK